MTTTKSAQSDREAATSTPRHKEARPSGNIVANDVSLAPGDLYLPTQQSASVVRRLKEAAKCMLPDSVFLSLLHHKCIGRYPNLLRPATFNEKILQRSLRPDQIPADYKLHCFGGRPGRPIIYNQGRVVEDDALKRAVGRVADRKAVRLV